MRQKKGFYLTKEGLKEAKKEYETLKKIKLSKLRSRVFKSFDPSDLDPEYFAFQDDMGFLNSRIGELKNVLRNAKLIESPPKDKQGMVSLGATILVEVGGDEDEFQIVGTLEANPSLGKISDESPVGKALLGHRVGDIIIIESGVKTAYKIKKIKYKEI